MTCEQARSDCEKEIRGLSRASETDLVAVKGELEPTDGVISRFDQALLFADQVLQDHKCPI